MATSGEQIRAWRGPALFSFGFRPFFLGGGVWVCLSMIIWLLVLSDAVDLPTRFDPVSWHAHAFLFGYLSAVIAGFLLTAVPNWTGRLPIVGWPLAGLFTLWCGGRAAVLTSEFWPVWAVAAADISFQLVLAAVLLREIITGKNWRNLIVLGLLVIFGAANLLFHIEASLGQYAAQGVGLRLGLGTAIMLIAVIGGRIVPSFTRNWLARTGASARPVPPMLPFDKVTLVFSIVTLLTWIASPTQFYTGVLLIAFGLLHTIRLFRWQGHRTLNEPIVWVLHAAYAMIPLGAFTLGLDILLDLSQDAASQHIWMSGAIGAMTLAVMTRATRGHTGQDLKADKKTTAIYLCLFAAISARWLSGAFPVLISVSGVLWIVAFGGFTIAYGPLLWRQIPKNLP